MGIQGQRGCDYLRGYKGYFEEEVTSDLST